jgi:hypothetical protein
VQQQAPRWADAVAGKQGRHLRWRGGRRVYVLIGECSEHMAGHAGSRQLRRRHVYGLQGRCLSASRLVSAKAIAGHVAEAAL